MGIELVEQFKAQLFSQSKNKCPLKRRRLLVMQQQAKRSSRTCVVYAIHYRHIRSVQPSVDYQAKTLPQVKALHTRELSLRRPQSNGQMAIWTSGLRVRRGSLPETRWPSQASPIPKT